MNVLFVCTARSWGGNEKWSLMAIRELESRGHRVHLVARKASIWQGKLADSQIHEHFFLHYLNPWSYIHGGLLLQRLGIDRVLSTKRAEYVVYGVLSRLFHIRHLIRLGIVREIDTAFKRWVYGRLNDGIVVNAKRIRTTLNKCSTIHSDRVKVIYNGIPDPPAETKSDFSIDPLRIVSVGLLQPRKGFHRLIKAVSLLPPELSERIELTILGEGEQRTELEARICELGLQGRVSLPGFSSDVSSELRKASLFVLVSNNEGLSNALLEALSHGLPVLTTDSGGTGEVLTDGEDCILTDGSPEDIAAKLQSVLAGSINLSCLSARACKTAVDTFSLTRMGDELEAFLLGDVRLRILHLLPELRPGGGPINTLRFMRASHKEAEHYAAASCVDPRLYEEYRSHTRQTWDIDLTRVSLRSLFWLLRIVRQINPDVVQGSGKAGSFYGTVLRICTFRRFKFYLTLRGFKVKYSGFKKLFYILFEKFTAFVADGIICVSPSEREYYRNMVQPNPRKILLIPNGIDVTRREPPEDIAAAIARFKVNIVSLSRTTPQKDLVAMLNAFEKVAVLRPDSALHIIGGLSHGEERYERKVRELHAELRCRTQLFFWGDRDSAGDYLHAFDLYWSTALFEGLPTAIIEAFLNGIPVVGTACVGNVDLIRDGETGRLTEIGDVEGTAATLTAALADLNSTNTRRMIEKARSVGADYSPERQRAALLKLYRGEAL